ncbi:Mg(2+) transport ATPase protein C [Granulibacter bethesdensis]|nr:Mg(2+) transport ATPase protein C [Granulibacter bethesdensis]
MHRFHRNSAMGRGCSDMHLPVIRRKGLSVRFIETFDPQSYADTAISLTAAFLLATLIGAERQYRQRTAGLRTNVLVSIGAATFVDLAMRIEGSEGAVRVIAYVVSGIGFLGAGVIMKEGMNVRGLNTAATLWCSAAVGSCAGADMVAEAALLTLFVMIGNTLLRPLANAINRTPFNEMASEAHYEVRVICPAAEIPQTRDLLAEFLEDHKYSAASIDERKGPNDTGELVAQLVSTAVNPQEMDQMMEELLTRSGVLHAGWEVSTRD